MRQNCFLALAASIGLIASTSSVQATPYASGVSVATVSGTTTVTYTLNEDTDTLNFSVNGGAFNPAPDGVAKGTHTFTLPSPTATFSIQADKNSAVGYTIPTGLMNPGPPAQTNGWSQPSAQAGFNQINNDTDSQNLWSTPRGIDVNRNPNTPNFGTYYVANSNQGTGGHSRGIFAFKADTSLAYGDGANGYNPTLPDGSTAAFTNGAANSPFHLTVAADGTLWESGYADVNSNVLQLDPTLASPTAQNIFRYVGVGGAPSGVGVGPSPPEGDDPLTATVETTFPTTPDQTALTPWNGCLNCTTEVQNHGSVASVFVTGSLAGNNLTLYTIDEDMNSAHVAGGAVGSTTAPSTPSANPDFTRSGLVNAADYVLWRKNKDTDPNYNGAQGYADWRALFGSSMFDRNSVWKYTIGNNLGTGNTGTTVMPTQVATGLIGSFDPGGIIVDMTIGPDGKVYLSQSRNAGNEAGVIVADPTTGSVLFNSLTASRALLGNPTAVDILSGTNEIAVTPDDKYLVLMINSSDVGILPLINGIPDLANRMIVDSSTVNGENSGRDISVDAAGNIYYVSSGQGLLRILSPGGHTLTTLTWNGTAYSFNSATLPGSGSIAGGAVPEPGTLALALVGLTAIGFRRRR